MRTLAATREADEGAARVQRGLESILVMDSEGDEDVPAPLGAVFPDPPSVPRRVGAAARQLGKTGILLASGLLGAALLLSGPRGGLGWLYAAAGVGAAVPGVPAPSTEDMDDSLSLYVNLSAVGMGEAGKPSEYLLLHGPPDNPNTVAIQVKQGECALDSIQAANYLGRAGLQITQAVKVCKPVYNSFGSEKFPGNNYVRTACAADASGILSSFSFVATYLSLAASHCSQTVNLPAICASSATGLIAALAKVSVQASTMAANCEGGAVYSPGSPPAIVGSDAVWQNDRRLQSEDKPAGKPVNQSDITEAVKGLEETWKALHALNASIDSGGLNLSDPGFEEALAMEREGEIATCVIDATQAATFLAQMGVAMQKAAKGCPLQPALKDVPGVRTLNDNICAGSVLEIISGLFNAGAFVASAISHCALGINTQALCAQGAVGLVAAVSELINYIIAMHSACKEFPPILENLKHKR